MPARPAISWRCTANGRSGEFTGPEARYIWALNGVPGGPDGIRLSGVAATVDEAEAGLKTSWEEWLAGAHLSDVRERF
jgi:hypothetical protein